MKWIHQNFSQEGGERGWFRASSPVFLPEKLTEEELKKKSGKKTSRCSQQLWCKSHMSMATEKAGHISSHKPKSVFFPPSFHSSYFQCSQEQKWLAIKTLLKHFCCCQRPRGGVPSPNAEMLSPCSSSLPLSILWARRCKMSNNLIWASKFYRAFSRQEWGGVACASAPSYDLQSWTF